MFIRLVVYVFAPFMSLSYCFLTNSIYDVRCSGFSFYLVIQMLTWENLDYVMCAGSSSRSPKRSRDSFPLSSTHRPFLHAILKRHATYAAPNLGKTGKRQLRSTYFPGARGMHDVVRNEACHPCKLV